MKPQERPTAEETGLIEAEIQHNIPVKSHIPDELKNPIAAIKQLVEHDNKKGEKLDSVLADVNKSVKESDKKQDKKTRFFNKKEPSKQSAGPKQANKAKKTGPVFVVVFAILVAAGLSFAAFSAFSQPKDAAKNKSSTSANQSASSASSQVTSTTELTSDNLSSLSSTLETKISSLNDAKDFNATDLSDKNLGF